MPELNQRLAAAVIKRRMERGWSQLDVYAQGGPSDTTMGKIETGVGSIGRKTLGQLDMGLKWEPGTAMAVLTGRAQPQPPLKLADVSNDDLLAEVRRRMEGARDVGPSAQKSPDPGLPGRRMDTPSQWGFVPENHHDNP